MPTIGYRRGQLPTPLLTIQDTIEYLRISPSRLNVLLRDDASFPAHKIGGEWRFIADDLEDWVRTHPKRINRYRFTPATSKSGTKVVAGKEKIGQIDLPTNVSEMTEDEVLEFLNTIDEEYASDDVFDESALWEIDSDIE